MVYSPKSRWQIRYAKREASRRMAWAVRARRRTIPCDLSRSPQPHSRLPPPSHQHLYLLSDYRYVFLEHLALPVQPVLPDDLEFLDHDHDHGLAFRKVLRRRSHVHGNDLFDRMESGGVGRPSCASLSCSGEPSGQGDRLEFGIGCKCTSPAFPARPQNAVTAETTSDIRYERHRVDLKTHRATIRVVGHRGRRESASGTRIVSHARLSSWRKRT